jgi:DNA-binding response OmpR family regulator
MIADGRLQPDFSEEDLVKAASEWVAWMTDEMGRCQARLQPHQEPQSPVVQPSGGLYVSRHELCCSVNGGPSLRLSRREYLVLDALVTAYPEAISRACMDQIFSGRPSNVAAVYIRYLRRKLGAGTIRTVRGQGYALGVAPTGVL